jgi:D-glycero-D-manno-heptose 1,7-bisphosphate phosphatase
VAELQLVDGVGCWCEINRTFAHVPALFIDRDGVLIEDTHYLRRPEDVRMIAGVGASVATMNRAGIPVVVVTNQSGIGRGFYDWRDFAAVQATIVAALAGEGAALDAVLACAYHADAEPPLRVADHPWRKPRGGMIVEAARRMNLDLARSWIVGDKADDLLAGRDAALAGGVLVATGHGADEQGRIAEVAGANFVATTASSLTEACGLLREAFTG